MAVLAALLCPLNPKVIICVTLVTVLAALLTSLIDTLRKRLKDFFKSLSIRNPYVDCVPC